MDAAPSLESLIANDELARRAARAPDFAAENDALVSLAECMASSPKDVLERLVQVALRLCGAQSAGISLAEEQGGRAQFRWRAAAGRFAPLVGSAVPSAASPSALVLARNAPTLFRVPRLVSFGAAPVVDEALLVPLDVSGGNQGTLWVVAHDDARRFDREDARLLASLARFAALGLRTLSLLGAETRARRESQQALRALQESEQRFAKFMQRLPGLAWIKDLGGRYVFVNDAAELVFRRHARGEILGRTDLEIFPPEVAAQFRRNDADALASGGGIETVETLEHDDGVHHSIVAKFPIPGASGEPSLIGGVAIDVTARIQAEAVIRESEERFRAVADNAPVIIYTTQPDGYCTFLSRAWTVLTGLPIETGLGFGWADAIHPDDVERTRAVFQQRPPAPFRIEFRLASQKGGHHWMIGTGAPRQSPDGALLGFVGSVLDVHKEKSAEEALRNSVQLYRALGESIDYGVWLCDPDGHNVYASQSFLNLLGMSQEECAGIGWSRALHPDDRERAVALWKEGVRTGQQWDIELRFRGADGHWHPVLSRGVRVKDERGETTAWAGINLDISRLKQVEDELREVDRRKDEFLATLSHELRNPLAPIRNSLHALRLAPDAEQAVRAHDVIDRQVNHLIRLVDDLLEVARITSGKIELRRERVELAEVVRAAIETSRPAIERGQHELEVDLPPEPLVLDADGVRLAQVVANLLSNAAKYTEERGKIWVGARREGSGVVLSVRDNGVGIPQAMLPRVFDLFTQVDRTLGRAQGGLGIGLALVKRLVEMHGGRVEAHSPAPGRGSEFTVRLPLAGGPAVSAEDERRAPEPAPEPGRTRRFLVVDDNGDAADSLALLLRLRGAEAQVAYDGRSALEAARESRPDIVLLDLGLPGMDGFEIAAHLRAEPALAGTVLVALTGWGQPEQRRATRDAGFDLHLVKPVGLADLRALLTLPLRGAPKGKGPAE